MCAHGIRLTLAEIRLAEVLLLAGQKLLDEHGDAADPYLTTVGYFTATRELAGMRRYLDDDVTTRVTGNTEPFPRRTNDFERLEIGELTSRISVGGHLGKTLDKLSLPFTERWSTRGRAEVLRGPRCGSRGRQARARLGRRSHTTSCSRRRCSRSVSTFRGSA